MVEEKCCEGNNVWWTHYAPGQECESRYSQELINLQWPQIPKFEKKKAAQGFMLANFCSVGAGPKQLSDLRPKSLWGILELVEKMAILDKGYPGRLMLESSPLYHVEVVLSFSHCFVYTTKYD